MNDISVCNGCIGKTDGSLQYCPLRENCLRHKLFLSHKDKERQWQVVAEYKDGKCELQIKMNDEKDNVQ